VSESGWSGLENQSSIVIAGHVKVRQDLPHSRCDYGRSDDPLMNTNGKECQENETIECEEEVI